MAIAKMAKGRVKTSRTPSLTLNAIHGRDYPVVLGSLYSGKRTMPYPLTADNFTKAIVTRSQMKLTFDEDKKVVTISMNSDIEKTMMSMRR